MLFLYSTLYRLLTPFVLLRLLLRSRQAPAYRQRLAERWGFFRVDWNLISPLPLEPVPEAQSLPPVLQAANDPARDGEVIWVHSVSVGESIAIAPLVKCLMLLWPEKRFVVTTMTPTGSEQVQKLYGNAVFHVYAPYDTPGAVRRFLDKLQPSMLLLVETELWPNMLAQSKKRGVKTVLLNARLSEKSAAGYGKSLVKSLTDDMLASLDAIAVQNEHDMQRFIDLGYSPDKIANVGSVKFDVKISEDQREHASKIKTELIKAGKQKVLIVASTHEQEDEIILRACRDFFKQPDFLLILVPRHPERFNKVDVLCRSRSLNVCRVTEGIDNAQQMQVLLIDQMGMLMQMYGVADVAFVAGSLLEHLGGHNLLEPAAWGLPVISGKHLTNFAYIRDLMLEADGLTLVDDADQLNDTLQHLFADGSLRLTLGQNAYSVVEKNKGALEKQLQIVINTLG